MIWPIVIGAGRLDASDWMFDDGIRVSGIEGGTDGIDGTTSTSGV